MAALTPITCAGRRRAEQRPAEAGDGAGHRVERGQPLVLRCSRALIE